MKRSLSLLAAAAALALPAGANAQSDWFTSTNPTWPGFYLGAEGAASWLLNNNSYQMDTGWAAGGKVGYDFVGPRVELEAMYHSNTGTGVVAFHRHRRGGLPHRLCQCARPHRPALGDGQRAL